MTDKLTAVVADIRATIEDRRRKSSRYGYTPRVIRIDVATLERWARELEGAR